MMNVSMTGMRKPSVVIAKSRLKTLLTSDRVNCTPDTFEKIKMDLLKTVSKYIEVEPEHFDVHMTASDIYIKLTQEAK